MDIRVEALPLRDPTGRGVWQPMKDPKTGRVYWTNHALQKTVWKPPQACTHVPAPASPWLDELLGLGLAGALVDLAVDTNMVQMTNASREKKRKKARYVRTPYTFPPVYATYVHHTHSHLQYTMGMVYGVSTCTSPPKPCAHHPTYTIRTPSHLLVLSARKCEDRQENEASSRPWTCGPCKTMRWWWSRTTQA